MSEDIFQKLQAAASDEEREWLLLEMVLQTLVPGMQGAVWAAAVPHWFDEAFLEALLDEGEREAFQAAGGVERLTQLSFIETFPGYGYNVHERTRQLLQNRLWRQNTKRYRELSRRAATYCQMQDQNDTVWRAEMIYHQLLADEPGAVDTFASQGIEWYNSFAHEKVEVLIRPVLAAVEAGWLNGDAAAWVYYRLGQLDITYDRYLHAQRHLQLALKQFVTDQDVKAKIITALGDIHYSLNEYSQARQRYEEALSIYRDIGDRVGEANTITALGDVHQSPSEYSQARQRYEEALPIYRDIGDRVGEANTIQALGDVHQSLSEYSQARQRYEEALPIYRDIGDRLGEANTIQALGDVHQSLAEYSQARQRYEEALPIYRDIGNRLGEANTILNIGYIQLEQEAYEPARRRFGEARQIYEEIGTQLGVFNVLLALADLDRIDEAWEEATAKYKQALEFYEAYGLAFNVALAYQRLGHTARDSGDVMGARGYYEAALQVARRIGSPLADEIEADLKALES